MSFDVSVIERLSLHHTFAENYRFFVIIYDDIWREFSEISSVFFDHNFDHK